jgi:hypothetical protein
MVKNGAYMRQNFKSVCGRRARGERMKNKKIVLGMFTLMVLFGQTNLFAQGKLLDALKGKAGVPTHKPGTLKKDMTADELKSRNYFLKTLEVMPGLLDKFEKAIEDYKAGKITGYDVLDAIAAINQGGPGGRDAEYGSIEDFRDAGGIDDWLLEEGLCTKKEADQAVALYKRNTALNKKWDSTPTR